MSPDTQPNPMPEKMTPLQALFVIEYLKDLNGKQAAIRAGYSENTAVDIACENLQKPHIRKAVDIQLEARASRTLITADKVLHELFLIADCDPLDAFEANGDLKPMHEIPIHVRKAIAGMEVEAMYEMEPKEKGPGMNKVEVGLLKKLKFWDKGRAQENLAKHLRLLSERFEIGVMDASNFKFPGVTEIFVDSPQDLQAALDLKVAPKTESENANITANQSK